MSRTKQVEQFLAFCFYTFLIAEFCAVFLSPIYVLSQPAYTSFPVVEAYKTYLPFLAYISEKNASFAEARYGAAAGHAWFAIRAHAQMISFVFFPFSTVICMAVAVYFKPGPQPPKYVFTSGKLDVSKSRLGAPLIFGVTVTIAVFAFWIFLDPDFARVDSGSFSRIRSLHRGGYFSYSILVGLSIIGCSLIPGTWIMYMKIKKQGHNANTL